MQLFDTARVNGAAYILAIAILGQMSTQALVDLTGDSDVTVLKYLHRMESRHLIVRVRVGHADHWHLAPHIEQIIQRPKFLVIPSSSSDLDPDLSLASRSDPEEEGSEQPKILAVPADAGEPASHEEDERERAVKTYLADNHYHLTGQYRAAYIDDDWITAIDFEMWLYQIADMKRNGIKIKFAEAYALQCLANRHTADPKWEPNAQNDLDQKLRYFGRPDEPESEPVQVKELESNRLHRIIRDLNIRLAQADTREDKDWLKAELNQKWREFHAALDREAGNSNPNSNSNSNSNGDHP